MNTKTLAAVAIAAVLAGCNNDDFSADAVATMTVDWDGDGEIDQVTTLTYSNIDGKLQTQEFNYMDETIDREVAIHSYDENGFESGIRIENAADGTARYTETRINDDRGNVLEHRYDWNADGAIDRFDYKEYNASNDVTRERYDYNGDGDIQRERRITFISPGQYTTRQYDDNGDGFFEFVEQIDYNPDQRRERLWHVDTNGDGTWDKQHTITWTDNPDGTVTRFLERDNDLSGSIDRTDTRVMWSDDIREYYDKTLSYVSDRDNDGNADYIETRTFNGDLQPLTEANDSNADGTPEWRAEYEYDARGNLTALRWYNANGDLTYSMGVTYQTWLIGRVELPEAGFNS